MEPRDAETLWEIVGVLQVHQRAPGGKFCYDTDLRTPSCVENFCFRVRQASD